MCRRRAALICNSQMLELDDQTVVMAIAIPIRLRERAAEALGSLVETEEVFVPLGGAEAVA